MAIVRRPHGFSLCKGIWAGWDKFFTFLSFSAGNGKRINFLHNVWCGDHSLKEVCVTKIL